MTNPKLSLLIPNFIDAINNIKQDEFDSHDFLGALIGINPQSYIETLYREYRKYEDPFKHLHSDIASELLAFNKIVQKTNTKIASKNIYNNTTPVEVWRKQN